MFEFESGMSGTMATIRSTPFYWRIHVFGEQGSAEALSENELVIRLKGQSPLKTTYDNVDTLLLEIEEFVAAVEGKKPFHVSYSEMLATVDAFERIVKCVEQN
jgi:acid phosphatase class B